MEVQVAASQTPNMSAPFLLVLTGATLVVVEYVLVTMLITGKARGGIYTAEYMQQFAEEHKATFPNKPAVPKGGYPDTGNGYLSKHLSYAAWFKMNNSQRAQINFLEQMPYFLVTSVIGGISYPWPAFTVQILFIIGRALFSIGYTKCGPTARIPGALIMDLCILATLVLSVMTVVKCFIDYPTDV